MLGTSDYAPCCFPELRGLLPGDRASSHHCPCSNIRYMELQQFNIVLDHKTENMYTKQSYWYFRFHRTVWSSCTTAMDQLRLLKAHSQNNFLRKGRSQDQRLTFYPLVSGKLMTETKLQAISAWIDQTLKRTRKAGCFALLLRKKRNENTVRQAGIKFQKGQWGPASLCTSFVSTGYKRGLCLFN